MRGGGLGLAFLLLLAACTPPTIHGARPSADGAISVVAEPLLLDPRDPARDRIGDFVFAGAVRLSSPDTQLLGGLSDLKVGDDGALTAESDEGSLLRAHVVLDDNGRLVGLDRARLTLLLGVDGRPLPNKAEADAEGVAVWPNGDVMVSFERDHRVWLYPAGGGRPRRAPRPSVGMPDNDGMEGLALAPAEGRDAYWVGLENGEFWLCHVTIGCARAPGQFPPPNGYRLPALFEMANGDLVVEHHHWDPVEGTHVVISVIDNPASHPRPGVKAQLRLDEGMTVDNVEGLAVVERAGGVRRFYLVTDDNFSRRQRTLLMAFDWTPQPAKGAAR